MILSIIIPYYNCLSQTKKLIDKLKTQITDDVEIIIVDDGCHEKELDTLGVIVYHLENNSGGASIPRNIGLDNAKGKYICFIDGDDYVYSIYIKEILQKIAEEEFDYCYFGWKSPHFDIIIDDEPPQWNCCVWNCVYKREIIGEERFDPKLVIGEDYDFNVRVKKGKHTSIKKTLYYYNDTPNSLTKLGIVKK